jgi:hypothetical protein
LRNVEAGNNDVVNGALLRVVAHQFERDSPRPGNGGEGEAAFAEERLRRSILCCVEV